MSECFSWGDGRGLGKFMCPKNPGKYFHHMVGYFTRQVAMVVIALGLLLNGAFPCCAEMNMAGRARIPAGMSMTMPGMSMHKLPFIRLIISHPPKVRLATVPAPVASPVLAQFQSWRLKTVCRFNYIITATVGSRVI